ncbi:hypothetical protein [Methylobacillus sp.]|uniref:hypothetical protein n=1 Tax=Methylobacillus sp. TaxID=56818 RepID=UPI0012C3ED8C|nr:hypothetical protein [Methylobacillus sp.]MPS48526.1 hypothetical protein [Methylobacillus sp.]
MQYPVRTIKLNIAGDAHPYVKVQDFIEWQDIWTFEHGEIVGDELILYPHFDRMSTEQIKTIHNGLTVAWREYMESPIMTLLGWLEQYKGVVEVLTLLHPEVCAEVLIYGRYYHATVDDSGRVVFERMPHDLKDKEKGAIVMVQGKHLGKDDGEAEVKCQVAGEFLSPLYLLTDLSDGTIYGPIKAHDFRLI